MFLTRTQGRGWEPDAVLNWLALAGWGTHTEPSDQSDQPTRVVKAPDSTTVMNLPDIINNVCSYFSSRDRESSKLRKLCSSSWMRSRIAVSPAVWLLDLS